VSQEIEFSFHFLSLPPFHGNQGWLLFYSILYVFLSFFLLKHLFVLLHIVPILFMIGPLISNLKRDCLVLSVKGLIFNLLYSQVA
jgi:hypothetical protein